MPAAELLGSRIYRGKVMEMDSEGKVLLEVDAANATTATGLPDGHILVASHQGQRVFEMDRTGKNLWDYKDVGNPYLARRR